MIRLITSNLKAKRLSDSLREKVGKTFINEQTVTGYLFVLPVTIAFLLFTFYPLLYSFRLSLTDWNGINPTYNNVGISNYLSLIEDVEFHDSFLITVYYTVGHVPLTMAAGLIMALILNEPIRGRSFFRTLFYTPNITPFVAVSIIWLYILNPDWGLLNQFLNLFGIPGPNWLGSRAWVMPAIIIFSVWRGMGYHMIIFLAGLQSIPEELYEAAKIDGANRWQLFRSITWPLLTPTTQYLFLFSMIGSFKVFTSVYVMTEGGPAEASSVLVYRIYQFAFRFFEMGYASAMSYVLFAVVLLLTLIQFRLSRGRIHYTG